MQEKNSINSKRIEIVYKKGLLTEEQLKNQHFYKIDKSSEYHVNRSNRIDHQKERIDRRVNNILGNDPDLKRSQS